MVAGKGSVCRIATRPLLLILELMVTSVFPLLRPLGSS